MVSLAVLVATGIKFEWYEALAIVQETCGLITESADRPAASALGPETIFVEPSGQVVTVTAAQHPQTAVQRMGALLKALLPPFHARATFHEVIDRASTTPPGYASLQELSKALSPFERPNRAGIVRGVYTRWTKMAAEPDAATAWGFTAQDGIEPVVAQPELEQAQEAVLPAPGEAKRRIPPAVAAAAAIVVLAVAAIVALRMRQTEAPAAPPPSQQVQASEAGADITIEPDAPASPAKNGKSAARRPAARSSSEDPGDRPRAREVEQVARRASDIPDIAAGTTPRNLEIPLENTARPSSGAAAIFGESDLDVIRPTPMYPQQLGRIPAGTRPEDVGLIEVVVNESGTVDSARVLDAPRSLDDALVLTMSLSAVKSWHFHPAVRDGARVKYRERIRVAMR